MKLLCLIFNAILKGKPYYVHLVNKKYFILRPHAIDAMNIHVIQFLIKIKNATLFQKTSVLIRFNKEVIKFLKFLYAENFILSFYSVFKANTILIQLKRYFKTNLFANLKILATSTKISYITYFKLCKIINKNIFILLSTDKGMLTDINCKRKRVGGKFLFSC